MNPRSLSYQCEKKIDRIHEDQLLVQSLNTHAKEILAKKSGQCSTVDMRFDEEISDVRLDSRQTGDPSGDFLRFPPRDHRRPFSRQLD